MSLGKRSGCGRHSGGGNTLLYNDVVYVVLLHSTSLIVSSDTEGKT